MKVRSSKGEKPFRNAGGATGGTAGSIRRSLTNMTMMTGGREGEVQLKKWVGRNQKVSQGSVRMILMK